MSRRGVGRGGVAWLRRYYGLRALVAGGWIAAVLATRGGEVAAATILLVGYPAWDALANVVDAWRSGGLARNRAQTLSILVSIFAGIAIYLAVPDLNRVLGMFGMWAVLAGLLQLGIALSRWTSAPVQGVMVVSGAHSAIIGGLLFMRSQAGLVPETPDFIPYVAFGAFYFAVAAIWLMARPGLGR